MYNLIRVIIKITLLLSLTTTIVAQKDTISSNIWDNLPRINKYQQEKIYLHFDKPYYVAGDRMWYRAHLVNADTHKPDTTSCAIYIELINSKDSLILRQKIRNKKGVYDGVVLLDETTPEGMYTVRAYTNWMRNAGDDYFYNRQFFIGNSITSNIRSEIDYDFKSDNKAIATIKFQQKNTALSAKKINYFLNLKGHAKTEKNATTDSQGKIIIDYNPNQINITKPYVSISYEDKLSKYERTFILPAKEDYDVQFFPEGGGLIAGLSNCIAFKAIQTNGLSTEITGGLFDNFNKKITDFKSSHLGMGSFYFFPESTKSYYALVKNQNGIPKKIELPTIAKNKLFLNTSVRNDKVFIGVKTDKIINEDDSIVLLGHSRGAVFYNSTIKNKDLVIAFNRQDLRPGIISFLVVDKNKNPLSERLIFIRPHKSPTINIEFDKKNYSAREKVNCAIIVTNSEGKPIEGSFSLSTTDASDIHLKKDAENIENTILLSSDLKGYIEKPNQYFDPAFKNADKALDILMLTQGWKRFNTPNLLKKEVQEAPNFLEIGQSISGTVKTGLFNKKTDGTVVSILGSKINFFDVKETDENGEFNFTNLFFSDSTIFTIYAKRNNGLKHAVEIEITKDSFPSIPDMLVRPEKNSIINDNYLATTGKKFVFENGIRNIYLEDIEIIGSQDEKEESISNEEGLLFFNNPDYVLKGAALKRFEGNPFSTLVRSLPGMESWNENIPDMNSDQNIYTEEEIEEPSGPQFACDGDIFSFTEVQGIDVANLESVKVLTAGFNANNKDSKYSNILIVVNFKTGFSIYSKASPPNIINIMPLGYSKDIEYYQPKYEIESVFKNPIPDWRSTIAWQSDLKTDVNGKGEFSFYTADRPSAYNFIIEGISPSGELCRKETTIMLRAEK